MPITDVCAGKTRYITAPIAPYGPYLVDQ